MCVPNVKTFDQTEGYLSSLDRKTGQTDRPTDRPTKPFLGRPPGSGKKSGYKEDLVSCKRPCNMDSNLVKAFLTEEFKGQVTFSIQIPNQNIL